MHITVGEHSIVLIGDMTPDGSPAHFCTDLAACQQWDDGEPISDYDREMIIRNLRTAAWLRGVKVQVI